jgi:hypothetical protein
MKVELVCEFCKTTFLREASAKKYDRIFCSTVCSGKSLRKRKLDAWLSGESDGSRGRIALQHCVRDYMLEQCGHKCSECGWNRINPTTGKCPLEVDHIDGDHTNNKIENLRVLCPNCHSVTPTYKSLNKGKGRGLKFSGSK